MNHEPLSKRMIRGSIVLIVLLLFAAFIPRFYYYFYPSESIEVVRQVKEYDNTYRKYDTFDSNLTKKKERKLSKFKVPPSKFDPNTYTVAQWMYIGLSQKQAEAILKFNKFGIYNEESLRKIKMINDECFDIIKDSIIYPKSPDKYSDNTSKHTSSAIILVEMNMASKEDLMNIKGIKDFLSSKIINYRNVLGGFVHKNQLLEVYGVTPENFDRFKDYITVDASKIRKININSCTIEELSKHPYISKNVANSIVKMRAKWEIYSNFGQLLESELIDQELLNKIQPYLTL